jgi:hypothetical protein
MKTADIKFIELCNEIDYWEEEAKHWKDKYDKLNKEHFEMIDKNIKHNYTMFGNILKALLSSDEKKLKENFKKE